jgi:hypothetical protein
MGNLAFRRNQSIKLKMVNINVDYLEGYLDCELFVQTMLYMYALVDFLCLRCDSSTSMTISRNKSTLCVVQRSKHCQQGFGDMAMSRNISDGISWVLSL